MNGEQWRPIEGFEGVYDVSNYGRIYSRPRVVQFSPTHSANRRGRIMRLASVGPRGVVCVTLRDRQGGKRMHKVHRLVAAAFIGPSNGMDVLHADDNPKNNHVSNLRYGNDSDNAHDRVRNGRDFNANRTRCKWGHEYTASNTYINGDGWRSCKTCRRNSDNRRRAA